MNLFTPSGRGIVLLAAFCWVLLQGCAGPAVEAVRPPLIPAATCSQPNTAVQEYFALIRTAPPEFAELVRQFPKGGDLHNHLSGSVMPEDYIDMGIEGSDCYGPAADDPARYAIRHYSGAPGACSPGDLPLAQAGNADLEKLVASLSMHKFDYSTIQSGHDQFFAAFGRFKAVSGAERNVAPMLAKLLRQAHTENVTYVETMVSFRSAAVGNLADQLSRQYPDPSLYRESRNYPGMFAFLQGAGLHDLVAAAQKDIAAYVSRVKTLLGCGMAGQDPACTVSFAFQAAVNRNYAVHDGNADLPRMFTQTAFSTLLADTDPRVAGVNLVSGEDHPVAMGNFTTEMQFFSWFHRRFPNVNIALHGGEITPCFVGSGNPALKDHLTGSLEAGAKRLGHAVSFAYLSDSDKAEVAALMKSRDTLVELPLTSNAQILGVAGNEHPFPQYFRTYGIPSSLATDDAGVSHTGYTAEWLYAIMEYGLTYEEAVRLARYSLQYSFLPGSPLWTDVASAQAAPACAGLAPGGPVDNGSACAAFLQGSRKALLQWDYESRLARFDRDYGQRFRSYLGGSFH